MEKIHNKTKDKILKLLLSNKKKEFTIRAIAKNIKIDYKSVYIAVNDLIKKENINSKRAGQSILCSANLKKFNSDVFRAETIRKQEILTNKDLHVLHNNIGEIKKPFFILLLFGSYASKEQRKGSDIDLMLITDDEKVSERVKNIVRKTPLEIHLLDFSSEEFLSMLKTTEFNIGREAYYNNVILFGIEDYYRLIQNA
ncbi:MAG: nucleotidyltransferase domain-containing protein [Nanoarchaeota archaeon]|nr:nucleotidyltransferase domain-containing protein [Nanoarchaeota archaeon]